MKFQAEFLRTIFYLECIHLSYYSERVNRNNSLAKCANLKSILKFPCVVCDYYVFDNCHRYIKNKENNICMLLPKYDIAMLLYSIL